MKTQETISESHLAAARAVDQLRRQLGLVIQEDSGISWGACPVEGLTEGLLSRLRTLPGARFSLLLTGARARNLGLEVKDKTAIRLDARHLTFPVLQALADPLIETISLPPFSPLPATASDDMLLTLAKYAALLPAMLIVESETFPEEWIRVAMTQVKAYWEVPRFDIVPLAQAALPLKGAENVQVTCFRERYGTGVHLCLTVGTPDVNAPVLTRVHSSCVTGDILGSLRCDCGDQLQLAMERITAEGSGMLIYLHQEGRGIGLANKLRAYRLQERGVDTYEANLMLGFEEDERDFFIAGAILKKLNVKAIRLLTNNPRKLGNLGKEGIVVAERVPLVTEGSSHSHPYLDAKRKKAGHIF